MATGRGDDRTAGSRTPRRPASGRPVTGRPATGRPASAPGRAGAPHSGPSRPGVRPPAAARRRSDPARGGGARTTAGGDSAPGPGRESGALADGAEGADPRAWRTVLGGAPLSRRTVRLAALATVLLVLVVLLGSTVRNWVTQRSEISALREQVAARERSVRDLQKEQARWEDEAYVEQQARQRLKFVRPGERAYTLLDDAPATPRMSTSVATSPDAADLPWYGAVWESTRLADAPASPRP